jgi:hypothetical protein
MIGAPAHRDIAVDCVIVDTERVPRATSGGILRAWRDGYVPARAAASRLDLADVRADFDAMITEVETSPHYAVWHVPVISARRP